MFNEQDHQQTTSLGEKLKDARLAKQLDLKEAAKALRFKPELLVALEKNDYTDTRSVVFARGYLKAYARLLELNEQEILDDFKHAAYADSIISHKPAYVLQPPPATKKISLRWVSYLVLIAVIGCILWWGYDRTVSSSEFTANLPNEEMQVQPLNQRLSTQEIPIKPQTKASDNASEAISQQQGSANPIAAHKNAAVSANHD